MIFLLVWDKGSYTGSFLVIIPCIYIYIYHNPNWVFNFKNAKLNLKTMIFRKWKKKNLSQNSSNFASNTYVHQKRNQESFQIKISGSQKIWNPDWHATLGWGHFESSYNKCWQEVKLNTKASPFAT
jgi:hypothetical protein